MLHDLPQDLLLAILSNLEVSDIANLGRVCKAWNNFINENDSIVFRAAAVVGLNVPPWARLLQDLSGQFSPRSIAGVSTWKELCARLTQINKSWRGITQSTITSHILTGNANVHRFKIDEQAGLIIVTTSHGELSVTNLNSSKWYHGRVHDPARNSVANMNSALLWALPDEYVRPNAHCEYGHGYLIFDRLGGCKEVWRLTDYDKYYPPDDEASTSPPTVVPQASPDDDQRSSFQSARRMRQDLNELYNIEDQIAPARGQFVPWALLHPPISSRAFRFVYPILLVVSMTDAFLYDVRTGAMVQEIRGIQSAQPLLSVSETHFFGDLYYVEHSPRHVFICGESSLRVFSRQTGRCVYEIPSTFGGYGCSRWKIGGCENERSRSLNCIGGSVDDDPSRAWDKAGSALYRHEVVKDDDRPGLFVDQILGAHASSCGNYLSVLLQTSRVLIIRDLERLFKGEVSLFDCTIEVQLGKASRFSRYHAFENGRVGVATRNGVFIVIPHPSFFSSAPLSSASPAPSVLRVHALNDPFLLESISCLQMTGTGLFVTWSPECRLTRHVRTYPESDRREMYVEQEDIFWTGLEELVEPARWFDGNLSIDEEDMLMVVAETAQSVVLSVDFVQT